MSNLYSFTNYTTTFYIFEYDSNLYMIMSGQQQTDATFDIATTGFFYNFAVATETSNYDNLETKIVPKDGIVSFLDSDYSGDDYDVSRYASTAFKGDDAPHGSNAFGDGGEIVFDSNKTYSSKWNYYRYYADENIYISTETSYKQDDDMAFFSIASGYSLDDIGITSGYDDYYGEETIGDGDLQVTFHLYYLSWKVDEAESQGEQKFEFYLATIGGYDSLIETLEAVDAFDDDEFDDIETLIAESLDTGNSNSGDDLIVIEEPSVPEPSTYALLLSISTLTATALARSRKSQLNKST
ncbi:PEP-CTERM sorting domain-containing protein [Cerasicoccus frondis]|uniref:PEP-CTERM sorting domain-containing protein n=1 Tax=Cerasicoccus frondis TaxID=490090 RepID=UPI002852C3C4|nr:PEP-CTERM sorting domain-containing protein [Cerasicoccus frondis]